MSGWYKSPTSPLPVVLTDGTVNIGTVNGELEVQLSAVDNSPDPGDVHDSVRIGDGTNELKVNPDGSINVVTSSSSAAIPTIANIPILFANTEYSYAFPLDTKKFSLRDREGDTKVRIAYATGDTSTNYYTLPMGNVFEVNGITSLIGFTIFFQTTKANRVIEILSWV